MKNSFCEKVKIAPRVGESSEFEVLGGPGGFKNGSKKQVEKRPNFQWIIASKKEPKWFQNASKNQ